MWMHDGDVDFMFLDVNESDVSASVLYTHFESIGGQNLTHIHTIHHLGHTQHTQMDH